MYKFVIFDVDGTLVDTQKATIMALNKVLKEESGKTYQNKELRFVIGIPGEITLPKFGVKNVNSANLKWNQYLRKYCDYIKIYSGIEDLIIKLHSIDINMGLVTSNTRYELNGLLRYFKPFQPMKYMECSICADDTERHKPYPDPILKFLERVDIYPSQAIYIGDTIYDLKCAESSGVDFGLAGWGNTNFSEFQNAQFIFENPEDILSVICSKEKLEITL